MASLSARARNRRRANLGKLPLLPVIAWPATATKKLGLLLWGTSGGYHGAVRPGTVPGHRSDGKYRANHQAGRQTVALRLSRVTWE